jgi:hypothetical protein
MNEKQRRREEPLCIDIDNELKTNLRVWCVEHRYTMKEIIGILLKRFMDEEKKKEMEKAKE